MNEQPLVSCITVGYKSLHFIRHLLQGMQDAKPAFSFEYIVVDNGSEDGTAAMVRERFPWVRVIALSTNIGLGPANNVALREAKGKYIMHLNPDLTIFPGELEKWVAWMEAHADVGVSAPRVVNPDGTDQEDSCYQFPRLLTPVFRRTVLGKLPGIKQSLEAYAMKGMDRAQEQDVDWLLGAALLIRRDLLERIGNFDERFFLYFEDADVCRRIWMDGMRVTYAPVAKLVHYHNRQSRNRRFWQNFTNPTTRFHIMSGMKYFVKYFGKPNPRLVWEKRKAEGVRASATNVPS